MGEKRGKQSPSRGRPLTSAQLKRNAILHGLDGVFFFAAVTLFSRQTVMVKLISELNDSSFLLGLVSAVFWLGMLLPQTVVAKKLEGLSYKKPAVMACLVLQRVGWLVFLLTLFVWWEPTVTLTVFFAVLILNRIASGMITPLWTDWYTKTTNEKQWATVLGVRRAMSGVVGVFLGLLIARIMATSGSPARYRALLVLAVACYAMSAVFVALVREDRQEGLPNQRATGWAEYYRGLVRILVDRPDFRAFVLASLAVTLPVTLILTFLARYGLAHEEATEGIVGTFTAFFQGPLALGAVVGGVLSDNRNVIVPFRVMPLLLAAAIGAAVVSAHPAVVSAAFALLGLAMGIRLTCLLPAIFRFAEPHRLPSYTALCMTVLGIPRAVVPLLAGGLIDAGVIGFREVFLFSGALCLWGWLMFLRMPPPARDRQQAPLNG